jgi:predicted N-formylglutamate amidohydrolase
VSKHSIPAIVVTCEHGGNRVPREYAHRFRGAREVLNGHRGYDRGALELAGLLAERFSAPLVASETTRLLCDLNRSIGHRSHFSEFSRSLDERERAQVIARYYLPYRGQVEAAIEGLLRKRKIVFHISIHSFTPVLDGVVRTCDIGLLYDPRRRSERRFCGAWTASLKRLLPALTIRRNDPYRGSSDGFTTYLRTRFDDGAYLGIEVEVNQKLVTPPAAWRRLQESIIASLETTIASQANA